MLAGRYPSDEFAELRPRIVWDRTAGVVRGRTGARRLAVTNAGTIPDRGLFGVFQVDGGGRVGELDEEMVYEAREGQTFMLGASTWRIEEITRDRVLVSPAPGVPGAVPFWKGEGVGRPYELGRTDRRRVAVSSPRSPTSARRRLCAASTTSTRSPRGTFSRSCASRSATSALPTDRTVVVERFRDEIGDWRVCVLTPFGGRVHAPWAMALAARLRDALGRRGAVALVGRRHRAPLPRRRRAAARSPTCSSSRRSSRTSSSQEVGLDGALRRALPRERGPGASHPAPPAGAADAALAAAPQGAEPARGRAQVRLVPDRARDLPRVPPGRLRPAGAARDPPGPRQTREIDLVEVETPSASPMASSLLFDYVATYMYEDDTPAAERRAQALSLDRELLRELLGQEELRDLIDPGALAEVEGSLRPRPRNADELHDLLRRAGDLRDGELDAGFAETLVRERRAFRARVGGEEAP